MDATHVLPCEAHLINIIPTKILYLGLVMGLYGLFWDLKSVFWAPRCVRNVLKEISHSSINGSEQTWGHFYVLLCQQIHLDNL